MLNSEGEPLLQANASAPQGQTELQKKELVEHQ